MLYNKTFFIALAAVVLYLSDQVFGDGLWKGRCGNQTVPMTKVVDGSDVSKDEWPWMVRLKICYGNDCGLCGGSLISDEWILTAAHCVDKYKDETNNNIDAYLGDHDQYDGNQGDEFRFTIRKKNIHIHENYLNNLYIKNIHGFNDIALLKLDYKLDLNNVHKRLQPVCLPLAKSTLRLNDTCVATGWGLTNPFDKYSFSNLLQKVELPIVENAPCFQIYKEYQPNIQLCVGNENGTKDTGKGDSGGPLNCKQANDFWTVDGITSYGKQSPAVYTRVSAYIDWITATMIGK